LLKLNDISKNYQNKFVINKLTFHFYGKRYCIVGSNGSGKTTLLMLAAGLEMVSSGQVTLDGEPINSCDTKRVIGVSSDKIMLPDFLTPQQLLEFHCSQHNCLFPNTLINHLGFSEHLTTQICDLSLGNLKKISLLLALAHQPKCLLLDEPTTGLDHTSRVWLFDYLTNYQGQIIVTSHEEIFTANTHYQQVTMSELNHSNSAFS
jgi:ABC-type multidrug transport system ATPase subunit